MATAWGASIWRKSLSISGRTRGDAGHYDGDARCVPCGQLVLYPQGTGRDLVPFIDSFDEQGGLGCRDFGGFDYFDVVAALAESFDQLLLRRGDAIEAGQHQPCGCLHVARDDGFAQDQRQHAPA